MGEARQSEQCSRCGSERGVGRFCAACGVLNADPDSGAYIASRLLRLGGLLLEVLLVVATLGVGWLIWLFFTAQASQTPAKRMLHMYILDAAGGAVPAWRIWFREVVVKGLPILLIGYFVVAASVGVFLVNRDRRALHDLIAGTIVVHVREDSAGPGGGRSS